MTWFIFILGAMIAGFVQGLTGFAFALNCDVFLDLGITTTVGSTIGGVCFAMESYHCIRKRTKTSTPFFPCSPLYYCRIDPVYLSVPIFYTSLMEIPLRPFLGYF